MSPQAREKLTPVTAARPCAVCGKGHKCSRGSDGLLICGRSTGPVDGFRFLKVSDKDPQFGLYRADEGPTASRIGSHPDWHAVARRLAGQLTDHAAAELAEAMRLLPFYRVSSKKGVKGKLLIRRSEFLSWVEGTRQDGRHAENDEDLTHIR